jgi:uncharacterized protein YbcI
MLRAANGRSLPGIMNEDQDSDVPAPEVGGKALTEADWLQGVDSESRGGLLMALSNAMVGLKKRYYGKGPEKARTFINENYVFCVMESVLTTSEQTLLEAGEDDLVRSYRLRFEEVMSKTTTEAVEQLTGRKVLSYHSQIVFRPDRAFEIFVLNETPGR